MIELRLGTSPNSQPTASYARSRGKGNQSPSQCSEPKSTTTPVLWLFQCNVPVRVHVARLTVAAPQTVHKYYINRPLSQAPSQAIDQQNTECMMDTQPVLEFRDRVWVLQHCCLITELGADLV